MHRIGREELASGRKYRIYMECRNSKSTNQRNCVQSIHPHLYRMWIYVSSECTGRTYNPEQIQEAAEEISLLLYHYSDLCFRKNAGLSIPYLSNAPIANMRLERKEMHCTMPKGVVLCDLFSAGQNAQLKWSHSGFKKHVSAIYQSKCTCCIPPGKKKGFLPALPEIAGEKLSRKNPLFFLEARFIRCLHIPKSCFE